MIKVKNLVPNYYYNRSRDFQLLGRIFELVFNYTKMNTDLMYNNPISDNSDDTLLDLLTTTLGFKSRHNYNVKQLHSVCTAFMTMLKNKGNIQSIKLAVNTILQAEGIAEDGEVVVDDANPYNIYIYIPTASQNLPLLKDLLIYLMPAGCSATIVQRQFIPTAAVTKLALPADKIEAIGNANVMTSIVAGAKPKADTITNKIREEKREPGTIYIVKDNSYAESGFVLNSELSGVLDNSSIVGTRIDTTMEESGIRKKESGEWGE